MAVEAIAEVMTCLLWDYVFMSYGLRLKKA
jgi:hypothetical protein